MDGRKRDNFIDGLIAAAVAAFLLVYSIVHHYTDPVRYAWGLSPYLFPTILAAVLLVLSAVLIGKGAKR